MQETLAFHEVDSDRWGDLERLFESSGGPKYCWRMVWRSMPDATGRSDRRAKKAAMKQRIRENVPVGILGYVDGDPVAWCSIAPRETYRAGLHHSRSVDEPGSVWSLACFFVPRRLRRRGVAKRLLYAASTTQGARALRSSRPIRWTRTRRATGSWASSPSSRPPDFARLGLRACGGT